jgi:hypothetical protein
LVAVSMIRIARDTTPGNIGSPVLSVR